MLSVIKGIRKNSCRVNIYDCYKFLNNVADNGIEEAEEQNIANIINSLDYSNAERFVEVLIRLATFKCEVDWCDQREGVVERKEIGEPIRLAAVKALGRFGDTKVLTVLKKALQDEGDMKKEIWDVVWYVYRKGDDIKEEAKRSIKKIKIKQSNHIASANLSNVFSSINERANCCV